MFTYALLRRYWFHLDSLLRNPRRLSAAQLESYVVQLASDGYTVYVVAGVFPKGVTQQSSKAQIGGRGQWFDADGKPIAGRDNRFSGSTNVGADSFTKAQVTLKQGKASDAAGKRAAAVQQYKAGLGYLVKVLGTIRDIPANKKKRDNITLSFTQVSHMIPTSPGKYTCVLVLPFGLHIESGLRFVPYPDSRPNPLELFNGQTTTHSFTLPSTLRSPISLPTAWTS